MIEENFVVLGLGANLGDRLSAIESATKMINLSNMRASKMYNTRALLPSDFEVSEFSICEWDKDFFNCVICGNTYLKLFEFFELTRNIELQLKRKKRARWAPREIDIDILFWNNEVLSSEDLTIPHIEMANRDFVLQPLYDVLPNYVHPVLLKTISQLLQEKMGENNE